MFLKDDTVKRRAIFISVLEVCKYLSATVNTFNKKAYITSARITFSCLIQVHRKSKQVTVIQRETNIGQLVTFNAVSGRRRRNEILKNNWLNNP